MILLYTPAIIANRVFGISFGVMKPSTNASVMNQYEVPAMIADELPELRKKVIYLSALGNIYETLNVLTTHTATELRLHHLRQVGRCMQLANRLYETGNEPVKNAVENIFVHAFSMFQFSCSQLEWSVVKTEIPSSLYAAYVRQVSQSGI